MAILSGNKILAVDYTSAVGPAGSATAYSSLAAAVAQLSAIWGVGYGVHGYGQTAYPLPTVAQRSVISSSDWKNLRNALDACAAHVGTTFSALPPASFYNQGSTITADPFDYVGAVQTVESLKLNTPAVPVVTTPIVSIRTERWTGAPQLEALVTFTSEDQARYFFNSGGEILINANITGSTNAQSANWVTLLSTCGNISIKAQTTVQSGSGGQPNNVGYYSLGESSKRLFIQNATDAYAVNYIELLAQRENYVGSTGANGSQIRLLFKLVDAYGGLMDYVDGTLTVNLQLVRAGGSLSITTPATTVVTGVSEGGTPPLYLFNDTVIENTISYNVLSRAQSAGYNTGLNIPLIASVTVNPGVVCGSDNVGVGGFNVPNLISGSLVTLYNYGYIVGQGGSGGAGNGWGAGGAGGSGGWGMALGHATIVQNYGVIGGGGGGGGGSTAGSGTQTYDDPGGSGGGGAGYVNGSPGNVGPNGTYYGESGSVITGGAGGYPSPHGKSKEWSSASTGGRGGDLGQNGESGQGTYGGGSGGGSGYSIVGFAYVQSGSNLGDYRGPTV